MHTIPELDWKRVDTLIALALEEDLGEAGDVTTLSVVPEAAKCRAILLCKEPDMALCGLPVAERVFHAVDPELEFTPLKREGDLCQRGDVLAEIAGSARSVLTAERTALNFIQRLSGVATAAHRYAAAVAGTKTVVLDTRKTTPGYRNLEKYAVAVGGAGNHRIGLYDRVMIKDNHREMAALEGDRAIPRAVARARRAYPCPGGLHERLYRPRRAWRFRGPFVPSHEIKVDSRHLVRPRHLVHHLEHRPAQIGV